MKAVFILISLLLFQLSVMEKSNKLLNTNSDSGDGGIIVKLVERESREAKREKKNNSKKEGTKNKTKNILRNKNAGKSAGKQKREKKKSNDIKNKRKGIKNTKRKNNMRNNKKQRGPKNKSRRRNRKTKNAGKSDDKQNGGTKKSNGRKGKKKETKGKKQKYKIKNNKKQRGSKNKRRRNRKTKNAGKSDDKQKGGNKKSNVRKGKKKETKWTKQKYKIENNKKLNIGKANATIIQNKKEVKLGEINDDLSTSNHAFDYNSNQFKRYVKNENILRKLKRLLRFMKLINGKSEKAETTFKKVSEAIKIATNDGTTCGCGPLAEEARTANDQLQNCHVTAPAQCSDQGISFTKSKASCAKCSAQSCTVVAPSPSCTVGCTACTESVDTTYTLTAPVITHITDVCVPDLEKWSSRFRACMSGKTYSSCSISCQPETDQLNCQKEACECEFPASDSCTFESCLVAATSSSATNDCKYECLKNTLPSITSTPIDGLDCFGLAGFETPAKARRNRCLSPSINKDSGNFVDCRQQGRVTPYYINLCKTDFVCNLTSSTRAPSGNGRHRLLSLMKNLKLKRNHN